MQVALSAVSRYPGWQIQLKLPSRLMQSPLEQTPLCSRHSSTSYTHTDDTQHRQTDHTCIHNAITPGDIIHCAAAMETDALLLQVRGCGTVCQFIWDKLTLTLNSLNGSKNIFVWALRARRTEAIVKLRLLINLTYLITYKCSESYWADCTVAV